MNYNEFKDKQWMNLNIIYKYNKMANELPVLAKTGGGQQQSNRPQSETPAKQSWSM